MNALRLQCAPNSLAVIPPVVIAQYSDYSERRLQFRELGCDGLRINKMSAEDGVNDGVTEYDDEVRFLSVGRSGDLVQFAALEVRCGWVQVGHYGELEASVLGIPRADGDCLMDHRQR